MRDLEDYQIKYKSEPGEALLVKHRRKHILSIMKSYSHKNILEVGCGMEPLFMYMSDYESMTVVEPGKEFANNACLAALQKCDKDIAVIEAFFEDAVDRIQALERGIDYIVVSSLLHELERPDDFMKCLRTIALPETVIHINVPNANSFHRIIAMKMGMIKSTFELSDQQKLMQRNRVYDMDMLSSFCSEQGFEVIEKGSYFPKFLTGKQIDRMVDDEIVDDCYFDGLDSIIEYFPEHGAEIYVQVKRTY